ncbi:penicillin-binding transpeptidase domain-containing protein [Engelhardtia mirabilis]|uniref:beta-lactamase n=1 Tax=Engelhardtia mirabilis TaxID=2528011 RepID=A0A518BIC8_9BACT|nr:Penicillin-binding protein PbpB [Planctomycetes bacterium Pla133]QDV01029.1 Penicillin-binding protein PbpB [Planctomycetes bacterium Pla86]
MSPALLDRRQRNVTGAGLFLLLSLALVGVGARMGTLAQTVPTPAKRLTHDRGEFKQPPFFTLLDRDGRALARSLPTYAVEASLYNLWLGHTPERIIDGLAEALDLDDAGRDELRDTMLDLDQAGERRVTRWPLTQVEALALSEWIGAGGPGDSGRPVPGFRLERYAPDPDVADAVALLADVSGPFFELVWRPQVVLSEETRERVCSELDGMRGAAARWVRVLGQGLAPFFEAARERELALMRAKGEADAPRYHVLAADIAPSRGLAAELRSMLVGDANAPDPDEWIFVGPLHEWVFDGLMPRRHAELAALLPVEHLETVRALIESEDISAYQLWLQPTAERVYPLGESGVVGSWEWLPPLDPEPTVDGRDPDPVLRPSRGLEHLGFTVLRAIEQSEGPEIPLVEDGLTLRLDHLVAGEGDELQRLLLRPRRPGTPRDYYLDRRDGIHPAELETTLDLDLQAYLGQRLQRVVEGQDAALVMAVAIELESREVLAMDWRSKYGSITFPPLQHGFTPGSTFKLVTMALALQQGVVTPNELINVGEGQFQVSPPEGRRGRARIIREAEGFARGVITAAMCVARSSNAGMVQIGLRVPVAVWKRATADLGYGTAACPELLASGLLNVDGQIGESDTRGGDPWERRRSHASVSFGDSITTTLLQHAAAISALLDDGAWRPLRFARGLEVDDGYHELVDARSCQVVRPEIPGQLRAMMAMGATIGTGKDLVRPAGLTLYSKTGTTEKLAFDVCEHKYRSEYSHALETGADWDDAAVRSRLRGDFSPRRACYVPSIVVMAAHPETGREVLVMLVVDDPHGDEKFGSKVAGPAAVDVLCRALGLRAPSEPVAQAQEQPVLDLAPGADLPWAPAASAAAEVSPW